MSSRSPPRPPSNSAARPRRFSKISNTSHAVAAGTKSSSARTPAFPATCSKMPSPPASFRWGWTCCSSAVAHAGVAYATRSLRADAASSSPLAQSLCRQRHQIFPRRRLQARRQIEDEIENLVFSGKIENIRPTADAIGKAVRIDDALGRYIEFAKASFPRGLTLEGLRIVVDCAHGAAYKSPLRAARTRRGSHRVWQSARRHEHQPRLRFHAPEAICRKVVEYQGAPGHRARRRRRPRAAVRRKGQFD